MGELRPSVRVLHASDLHFHSRQRELALRSIRGLVRTAKQWHADAVVLAGDIFDSPVQSERFVEEVADGFRAFDAAVVMIPGNHDISYSESEVNALALLAELLAGRARLIDADEGEWVSLLGGALHVWGRGMPEHSPSNDPLAGLGPRGGEMGWRVALAHGELMDQRSLSRGSPIMLDQHATSLNEVQYLALGHHDSPSSHRAGETLVCYSGSASLMRGFGECALVSLDEPHGASTEIVLLQGTED